MLDTLVPGTTDPEPAMARMHKKIPGLEPSKGVSTSCTRC
jgi:hypothetical protein